jgi:hypothetical protein
LGQVLPDYEIRGKYFGKYFFGQFLGKSRYFSTVFVENNFPEFSR